MNKRVSDIQSSFQKQMNDVLEENRKLKTDSMSAVEREQFEDNERAAELERLQLENDLLKLAQKDPQAAEFLMKIHQASKLDDQFALAVDWKGKVAVASVTPEPETTVPDVDTNNPANKPPSGTVTGSGLEITDAFADQVLKGMVNWPTRDPDFK